METRESANMEQKKKRSSTTSAIMPSLNADFSRFRTWLLPMADVAVLFLSIIIAFFIRLPNYIPHFYNIFVTYTSASLTFPMSIMFYLFLLDGYSPRKTRGDIKAYLVPLAALILAALSLALFYFFIPNWRYGRGIFLLALAVALPLLQFNRILFGLYTRSDVASEKLCLVGMDKSMQYVLKSLRNMPFYRILGYCARQRDEEAEQRYNIQYLGTPDDLNDIIKRTTNGTTPTIVFDNSTIENPGDRNLILRAIADSLAVDNVAAFYEKTFGKIPIGHTEDRWIIHSTGFSVARSHFLHYTQRLFDIVLSVIMLLLGSPLMLLAAIAIKLTSRGPVIYKQDRVGKNNVPFNIYKFRSMYTDAEKHSGAVWSGGSKDPRVTPVGRFIRRTRIDELPQLVNVLLGQMSLIGPRPERVEFVKTLEEQIPFYFLRAAVKPGITGWAQVLFRYGASVEDAAEKLQYDLYYVKNRNMWLNLYILLKTVQTVLLKPGS